jgi:malate dehydrogenase (oxaloacetate-decarboxylating)
MDFKFSQDKNGNPCLDVALTDYALLTYPQLNKGMAFTEEERVAFNLLGLLPSRYTDLTTQLKRSYEALSSKSSNIEKYIYLRDLQDSNETLFFRLVTTYIEELMPLVYTPTVGLGCERFSDIYRRPRGLFISYPDRERIDYMLSHHRFDLVKVIVVSDGERILGLGDQGAGGMGIPIGKLALYTACAGIHPTATLPILLDTGTNNPDRLQNPLYIGWQHERIRGKEYDDFIERFVIAVKKRFPHVLLQWEDFAQQNANPILERFRNQLCTFNDDIQGTAAVAAGALFAAIRVTKTPLRDQRIVVVGAGSAGCGISQLIMQAMMNDGLSETAARKQFYLIDRPGLLIEGETPLLSFQKIFAQTREAIASWKLEHPNLVSLKDVVANAKPTLLIGVSGQPHIFSEDIVREMAKYVDRPIIFPLSNPTERCEATPSDLMKWTNDRAIIGTGSPFGEIKKNGKSFRVDQTNNCYIFPGLGLGLIAARAKIATDKMFMAAATALADCSPAKNNAENNLLPPLANIREVSRNVALATAKEAIASGIAQIPTSASIEEIIHNMMWIPEYLPYKKIQE